MTILGIESSCDETSAAVIKADNDKLTLLSQTTATSLALHAATGGIIPERAAREQLKYIIPVIQETLADAFPSWKRTDTPPIDAIAVTYGPGLIGSLLVGVETAKSLSLLWDKPLIPVNHLYGHIYANFISDSNHAFRFPALALVVSGGHTDLVLMKSHKAVEVIGGTRDDAAGEAFDKIGRLLGLSYPAGPVIAKLAEKGNPKTYALPRPMIGSKDFDFSFSGLKTAVLHLVKKGSVDVQYNQQALSDLCASVQQAIVDVLVRKTIKAAKTYNAKSILLGGGVAANDLLHRQLEQVVNASLPHVLLFVPSKNLCTDNGAMIAAAAYFSNKPTPIEQVTADPELYY
jgi:N6-L-threonylcarbamoyladenine synthase